MSRDWDPDGKPSTWMGVGASFTGNSPRYSRADRTKEEAIIVQPPMSFRIVQCQQCGIKYKMWPFSGHTSNLCRCGKTLIVFPQRGSMDGATKLEEGSDVVPTNFDWVVVP
jgi:hypothetical protein